MLITLKKASFLSLFIPSKLVLSSSISFGQSGEKPNLPANNAGLLVGDKNDIIVDNDIDGCFCDLYNGFFIWIVSFHRFFT